MTLKTKLTILFVAFTFVTLLLFGGIAFTMAGRILKTVRIAQLNSIADLKKDKVETFFNEWRNDLQTLQLMRSLRLDIPKLSAYGNDHHNPAYRAAKADLDERMVPLRELHGYIDIMFTDRQGKVVYVTNIQHEPFELDRVLREKKAFLEGKKGIYFTDVFRNKEIGNNFEMIGVAPIKDKDGTAIGEAIIEIDMDIIYRFLQDNTGLGKTGEALIARQEGNTVLFMSPLRGDPDAALKKRVSVNDKMALAAQKAAQAETGSGMAYDYKGTEVLAAWRFIPALRWGLVTKIDAKEAFAPGQQLRVIIIVVEMVMVLIGIFIARAIAKAVTKPLLSLQQGAEAIAAGDLNQRVYTGKRDEVGRLARAFDSMTDALARDIAERERTEKKLRDSLGTSQAILNATMEAVYLMDTSFTIVAANQSAASKLGRRIDEIIGAKLADLIPADVANTRKKHFKEAIRSKQPASFEDERAGMFFEHTVYPILDAQGFVERFVVYSRDITGRKMAEQEIKTLNEELKHHVRQLEETNKELEAFSYSVSHDLRSPLRSIAGFSQALLDDYLSKLDEEGRDALHRIVAATQRMGQLIDDLLNLSRLTRFEMIREQVDLSAIAKHLTFQLRKNHPERAANFIIADGLIAYADERLITVALENLIANAWKFSEKTPQTVIEFGVNYRDGRPVYFVKDNGAGFDATYADKLFNPFQRLHREKDFPGTGIGLATVKRIISRHGGRVWIEGAIGQGATVYFTLP